MDADLERYYKPALNGTEREAVLDFGSGHGRVLSFLAAAGFVAAEGFERDSSLEPVLYPAAKGRTTFGSDWRAFFAGTRKRWSAVVLKDVLYYFDDGEAVEFLRALRERLDPGAVLVLEVFNGATFTGPFVMYKDRGIKRVFTEHSLRSLLEDCGFSVTSMEGIRVPVTGVRSALHAACAFAWRAGLRAIYWCERGVDAQNPRLLDKKIFAVARAVAR